MSKFSENFNDRDVGDTDIWRRIVLENALDAVIGINPLDQVIDWNLNAEKIFGYSKKEAIGTNMAEMIIPPEYRESHALGIQHFMNTGVGPILNKRIELEAINKEGKRFPVELTVIPLTLSGSVYFYSFVRDISEKKKSEEALISSENLYHTTFSRAPVGIINTGPDGKLINVNDKICEMLGYSVQELKALTFIEITHPEDRRLDLQMFEEIKKDKTALYKREKRYVRKDGSVVWVHVTGQMLYNSNGTPKHSVTIVQDISARKKAEEEKQKYEVQLMILSELSMELLKEPLGYRERLQKFVDSIVPKLSDWCTVDILDVNGELKLEAVAHTDPAKVKLAYEMREKFPQKERTAGPFHVVKTKQAELVQDIPLDALRKMAISEEHFNLVKDLGLKSYVCVPILAHGETLGAFTMISESKVFDDDDLKFSEQLATRAALAFYNSRLYDNAQNALKARDEFLSIASHELKTPLTSLKIQAQLQSRLVSKGSPEAYSKDRIIANNEKLERSVQRLDRLVDDMLDISRIRTGKLTMHREEVNLSLLIQEVIDRMQELFIEASGENIEFEGPEKAYGMMDPMRIEQVISNLLQNALKYGLGKNVKVTVSDFPSVLKLSVSDKGLGIFEVDQKKIFERYERAINPNEISGFGLGLFISRQIILAHGGNIWVSSNPGEGATFYIEIPKTSSPDQQDGLNDV